MKRTPLKRGNKPLKKAAEKTKQKLEEENKEAQEKERMWMFLRDYYHSLTLRERRCQSCGRDLHILPRTYYFDHLIEKSKRPDLAMERDNIFLCCLECHALKTDGHPTEVHQKAIEKAKERFGIS